MALRPAAYQLVALTKLLVGDGKLLITDGVGVGKTIAAGYCISWVVQNKDRNALIICPVSLVDKWVFELREKFGLEAHAVRSEEELATASIESERSNRPRVYVLPFSRMSYKLSFEYGLVVIDEIHNLRNPETAMWKRARAMAAKAEWRIGLTATPINNKPEDLFSIYSILYSEYPHVAVESAFRYLWDNRQHSILNRLITRFEKDKLGIHFAQRKIHHSAIEYPEFYVNHVNKTVQSLTGRSTRAGGYPLETITYYRAASSAPPTFAKSTHTECPVEPDPKLELLKGILKASPRQIIVFCQFKETADYLSLRLTEEGRNTFVMTGDVPGPARQGVLRLFERDPTGVILLTAVGSEGLDMQFCDTVVNYDLHWNPMVIEQRIGRVDRVGQTKSEVHVHNLHVAGSIDERVLEVMATKLRAIKGTPFNPSPIQHSGPRMFSDVAEHREEADAKTLVNALEASRQLASLDLEVLAAIDPSYCSAARLTSSPTLAWLNEENELATTWKRETHNAFAAMTKQVEDATRLVQG